MLALVLSAPQTETIPAKRTLPLHRFSWSRAAQQDKQGFYRQAVALCDDYPEESRKEAKVRRDFEALRGTGTSLLRFGIAWESIEREPGKYNWTFWDKLVGIAGQYHITLLPYVCYTPEWLAEKRDHFWRQPPRDIRQFGEFVYAIVSRYRGKVGAWELWNEPDNPEFWEGTTAQFADMIREGAQAVRRADPEAVIVLGGMAGTYPTPFFQELKQKYQIENSVDVINIHGYQETWNNDRLERYPDQITAMAQAIQQPGASPDLWLAEFGYSDYRFRPDAVSQGDVAVYFDYEHTAAYQAIALFRAHILALAAGKLSLTAWYRINDLKPSQNVIGDDNNKFLGILDVDGKPKPAYNALKFYNRLFDQPVRCIDNQVEVQKPAESQSVAHCFEKKNGNMVVTAWLRSPRPNEVSDRSGMSKDERRETLRLRFLKHRLARVTVYRENGERVASTIRLTEHALEAVSLAGGGIFIAEIVPAKSSN